MLRPTAVKSFVEMTRFILRPGVERLSLLSEHISQDHLGNYFGKQHARGGRCDNPTLKESLQNAVAIRAQHSLELDHVQGTVGKRGVSLTLSLQRLTALPYQNAKEHEQYIMYMYNVLCQ